MPPEIEAGAGQESTTATESVVQGTTAPAATAATTTATETATAPDPFDNTETQTFDRKYVENLRNEAAKYRTEAKPYKEVFEGYDEQSQTVLLNVLTLLREDPAEGAKALREIAQGLSPEEAKQLEADIKEAEAEDEEIDVEKLVEQKLAERDKQKQEESAIEGVIKQATDLGYPQGDPDHITLLWIANHQTNGNLAEAAKVIEARNQKIIDTYVTSKQASNASHITPSSGSTPPAGDATKPKTFADVRARVEARIAANSVQE